MILFYIISVVLGILGYIAIGYNLSSEIENSTIYMLFWILYTITFVTLINIIMTFVYYLIMKNKRGPPGLRGPQGEFGEQGSVGKCEPECRDNICVDSIKNEIRIKLKQLAGREVNFNNVYLHHKIKQMCSSPEFKQTAPFNGPSALITYMGKIWKDWTKLLFDAGGTRYFETIGAESDWEWVNDNPFDEMKKYDIFYWGMGEQFRPREIDSCPSNSRNNDELLKVCKTNNYSLITNTDGMSGTYNASFWRPKMVSYKGTNYYPVGDIVIGPSVNNDNIAVDRYVGDIKLRSGALGPNRETILVAGDVRGPIKYELLWDSSDIGSNKNVYVWRPIGPKTRRGNYLALGDVITTNSNPPPTGAGAPIRCIREINLTKKVHNRNILWSSDGSGSIRYINLLGFVRNLEGSNVAVPGNITNAYNLFRGIRGNLTIIPDSDKNAQFYSINANVIDPNGVPGRQTREVQNLPESNSNQTNPTNQLGYQKSIKKDGKYSIQPFLQLKKEGYITHRKEGQKFYVTSARDNLSNAYLVMIGNKIRNDLLLSNCLMANGNTLSSGKCLPSNKNQYFRIEFTGFEKNQCRLKHISSKKHLIIRDGNFELVSRINNKDTRRDESIFLFS